MVVTRASVASSNNNLPTKKSKTQKITKNTKQGKQQKSSTSSSSVKRQKSPGVRFIGGRIYDSENGKTCHQCRQKTMDFSVSCKNVTDKKKQCTFHYCHICLLNRYGEKAEEAAALDCQWQCPSCRGVCNCSACMKKRGCRPTGILLLTAKANGFSSVSEMLSLEQIEKPKKDKGACSKRRKASNEEPAARIKKGRRENGQDEKANSTFLCKSLKSKCNVMETVTNKMSKRKRTDGKDISVKRKRKEDATAEKRISRRNITLMEYPIRQEGLEGRANGNLEPNEMISRQSSNAPDNESEEPTNMNTRSAASAKTLGEVHLGWKTAVNVQIRASSVDIPLPQGTELTKVANLDLPAEDVGHALQFLEFCEAFGQVFDLKKGHPEFLLQEVTRCQNMHKRCDFSLERLHIKLLSMIQKDSEIGHSLLKARGRNSWLEALGKHISGCPYVSEELILNCSHLSHEEYEKLNSSQRLRILIFLCDEALATTDLRLWIDEKSLEFVRERKKAKKMCLSQEKNARIKLKNDVAKTILMKNGAPLSISEHENLVSKIKVEVSQSLEKKLEATHIEMKKMTQSAVVRSDPILSDAYGRKFWKLRSHSSEMDVLLQDVAYGDQITSQEQWFVYDLHEKTNIERYISSFKV